MWSLQKATRKVDFTEHFCRRCRGTMVSMLDSRLSDLGQRSRMLLISIFTSTFVAFSCCSSSSLLLSSGLFGGKSLITCVYDKTKLLFNSSPTDELGEGAFVMVEAPVN